MDSGVVSITLSLPSRLKIKKQLQSRCDPNSFGRKSVALWVNPSQLHWLKWNPFSPPHPRQFPPEVLSPVAPGRWERWQCFWCSCGCGVCSVFMLFPLESFLKNIQLWVQLRVNLHIPATTNSDTCGLAAREANPLRTSLSHSSPSCKWANRRFKRCFFLGSVDRNGSNDWKQQM